MVNINVEKLANKSQYFFINFFIIILSMTKKPIYVGLFTYVNKFTKYLILYIFSLLYHNTF